MTIRLTVLTTTPCRSNGSQPECLVNSCGFLYIEAANFLDNFTCRVVSGPPGFFTGASKYFTSNGRHEPGWYFPGGTPVVVTCSTLRQAATATFTFPPDP